MTLPDLRILCRNNNIQPAGSKETLVERLEEMIANGVRVVAVTKNTAKSIVDGCAALTKNAGNTHNYRAPLSNDNTNNNHYARSSSQNVGNFLTGRNTSRVLAPPGGASSGIF
jgi:SPIRAL1-like protein